VLLSWRGLQFLRRQRWDIARSSLSGRTVVEYLDRVPADGDREILVPLEADGRRLYVSARAVDGGGDEREIGARGADMDHVLDAVSLLAGKLVERLRDTAASKVMVEFGCEFGIESGTLLAIVGKASSRSAVKVGLEWSQPER
jgi:hypothetical protein